SKEVVAQPVGWGALAERERAFKQAEEDRLLYVAATRAKQLLVISRYPAKPAIDPWSSLADTLQHHPELDEVHVEPVQPEPLIEAPNREAELAPMRQWLQTAAEPTFRRTSVTKEAKSVGEVDLHRTGGGGGQAF